MLRAVDPAIIEHRAIILRPLVTEKSMRESSENNKYSFKVDPRANKIQIARAIEAIFNVRVTDVHTMNVVGKSRRRSYKYRIGKTAKWKKAIVTLAQGSTIDVLEGGL
ncbi:MAG: 50S ribosomal protein L23 [Armatimonadota bacterium]